MTFAAPRWSAVLSCAEIGCFRVWGLGGVLSWARLRWTLVVGLRWWDCTALHPIRIALPSPWAQPPPSLLTHCLTHFLPHSLIHLLTHFLRSFLPHSLPSFPPHSLPTLPHCLHSHTAYTVTHCIHTLPHCLHCLTHCLTHYLAASLIHVYG